MIALLVMTDGRRDCITRTIAAALERIHGPISRRVIHDDSGDPDYRLWLATQFPTFELVTTAGRAGFGAAIANAWAYLAAVAAEPYVFHLEDDFVLTRDLDTDAMIDVLQDRPYLAQLALRRQPWNDNERAAGGIVEQHPDAYQEFAFRDARWLEHRLFFTTNPSLYRRSLCAQGWPVVQHSEGIFSHQLMTDPDFRAGFWGSLASGEWCEHIGHQRVGTGY